VVRNRLIPTLELFLRFPATQIDAVPVRRALPRGGLISHDSNTAIQDRNFKELVFNTPEV